MRGWRLAALGTVDAALLIALRPHLALLRHLASPHAWLAAAGTDAAVTELAAAAVWLAAAWLAIGLVACAGGQLPGPLGRFARALAHAVLPRAIYRIAAGAAGMSVLLTPGLAGAAAPDTGSHHPVSAAAPAWPTDDALRAPRWPTVSRHRATHPRTAPKPPAAPTSPQLPAHVTVTPGDSLWRIAAAHLPGHPTAHRVAAAWPRWYAANRRVIGADPDLIQPGQVLHPPTQGSRS